MGVLANGWKQNHSCVTSILNENISMSTPPKKLILVSYGSSSKGVPVVLLSKKIEMRCSG